MAATDITAETTDLTVIDGVGPAVADDLREAGYETVGDVADAELNGVADISGVGDTTAHDIIIHARDLADTTANTAVSDHDGPFVMDDGDVTLTLTVDDELFPYLIHVVLEEGVAQHQSNDFELREEAFQCALALEAAFLSETGPEYTFTCSQSSLTTLYRAVKQGAADYQNRTGISSTYGPLRALADEINEYR